MPSISLIIPVLNAAHLLPGCVASIRQMDYPAQKLELLVIDNGSTDSSIAVAQGLGATVLMEPQPGPYAARNRGAAAAQADVLAFTDADCVLDPGWAKAAEHAMAELDAACGVSLGAPGGPVAALIQERYEANLRGRARAHPPLPVFDTRNAVVRRSTFRSVGGFDARLDDLADDLFGVVVHRIRGRAGLWEAMRVTHLHPESLKGVWARQVRHGRNIPRVLALYPPDVTRHFPGIQRHGWLYGHTAACRMGRFAMSPGTAAAGAVLGVVLSLALRARWNTIACHLFELFNRFGTVHGMATTPRVA